MSKENQNAMSDLGKKLKYHSKKICQVSTKPCKFDLEKNTFHEAKYL